MAKKIMNNEEFEGTEETTKVKSKKKLWTALGIVLAGAATAITIGAIAKKKRACGEDTEEYPDEDFDCEECDSVE